MKRLFIAVVLIFFATSLFAQTEIEVLHKKILSHLMQYKKKLGLNGNFSGDTTINSIKFYPNNLYWKKDFITIFENGETLFSVDCSEWDQKIIIKRSSEINKTDEIRALMSLSEILIPIIGYDETLDLYKPFFDQNCMEFLNREIPKAEKKLVKELFHGKPPIPNQNFLIEKPGSYYYYGPSNWGYILNKIEFNSILETNSAKDAIGGVYIYEDESHTHCSPFGCRRNGKPITIDEFLLEYSLTSSKN